MKELRSDWRFKVSINGNQQELISELLKEYESYEDLPENLSSLISEYDFKYLKFKISNPNYIIPNNNKTLFVLTDYTNAFTTGVFANEPSRNIDAGLYKRTKAALEDKDTIVVVLIDSHHEDGFKYTREGRYLPVHGHTLEERLLYGETGKLFLKYWNPLDKKYDSEDGKVFFIEKGTFGCNNILNTINMVVNDAMNVQDIVTNHPYLNEEDIMNVMENNPKDGDGEWDWNMNYDTLANLGYREWIPDTVVVSGVATNVCVISNVVTLATELPCAEIVVYEDSVASYDMKLHEYALEIMENMGVKVIRLGNELKEETI